MLDIIKAQLVDRFAKSKPRVSLGMDIGFSSVKTVELSADPKSQERLLTRFAIKPVAGAKREHVLAAIKEASAETGTRYVNTSVSGQAVIVRYIQMPKMTAEETSKVFKLGLGKYIPFSSEEVNYDFQILQTPKKQDKNMPVLLVAVKRELVEERVKLLEDANLVPNVMDVDSFAIVNSFQLLHASNSGIIAIVDIGADTTTTTVLRDNVPFFSRDIPIGGNHITRMIMEEFDLEAGPAEEMKHEPRSRYGDLIQAVKPVLDSLCKEIQLSFNYCESHLEGVVRKIFLTGGTAKFKGMDKVLNSILGLEVEIWNPLQSLQPGPEVSQALLNEAGSVLTVAVGLSLRG